MEEMLSLKLLIIGDQSVGKTSFITRYCDGIFLDTYICTIGMNFKTKDIQVSGSTLRVNIIDPTGQEKFKSVPRAFYSKADGILLSFDSTDMTSYEHISQWVEEIHEHTSDKIPKILVATKCDLENNRQVASENGHQLAFLLRIPYFETSAKFNKNIDEAFMSLVNSILKNPLKKNQSFIVSKINRNPKKKCC